MQEVPLEPMLASNASQLALQGKKERQEVYFEVAERRAVEQLVDWLTSLQESCWLERYLSVAV